jgi:type III secretory pathway component EscR
MAFFKLSNFSKPSNKTLKLIADILLYTLPAYSLVITTSGLPEGFKLWANFIIGTLVITLKALTKFTTEEVVEVPPVEEPVVK